LELVVTLIAESAPGSGSTRGTDSNPGSAILRRQRVRESAARTYARSFPIVPVRAGGMTVEGADGRRYLDCLSGAGTLALGHNHPVVLAAIRRTLDSGAPLHLLDLATAEKDDFTTALLESLPAEFAARARVHFCGPAGTDAVEAALKLMQTATGRRGALAFTGGYHGMTAGALAVTGNVAVKEPLPAAGEVTRLPYPYSYRCPFGLGGPAGERLAAVYTERLLDDPSGGVVRPAAMILEPVQGEGGAVPAPDGWLREMRRITTERGIPLIVDEVQTGVGRTGAMCSSTAASCRTRWCSPRRSAAACRWRWWSTARSTTAGGPARTPAPSAATRWPWRRGRPPCASSPPTGSPSGPPWSGGT
jgi:diaminobutyrate-2-oxoglutarate transaminase